MFLPWVVDAVEFILRSLITVVSASQIDVDVAALLVKTQKEALLGQQSGCRECFLSS